MNQATSRRLRARTLLLLVPLLIASAPSTPLLPSAVAPVPVPGQPHHLVFMNLPPEFLIGRCTSFWVDVVDFTGTKVQAPAPIKVRLTGTLMSGTFHDTAGCSSGAVDVVTIPAGTAGVQVWYLAPLLGGAILTAADETAILDPAMTRPLSVVDALTNGLQLAPVYAAPTVGTSINVTVTAQNPLGVATGYAGTVHFSTMASGVTLPPDYTFDPAVDNGTKTFSVTFHDIGDVDLLVEDAQNTLIASAAASITVQPTAATAFRLENFPSEVRAGEPITFRVIPVDARGGDTVSEAQLRFFTDDSRAERPPDTPTNGTIELPATFTVTFLSASATPRSFKVADVSTVPTISLTTSVLVRASQPESVKLSTVSNTVSACGKASVKLEAFDSAGNPAFEPAVVTLCKDVNRSATFVETTLIPAPAYPVPGPGCVTGELRGTAQVVWANQVEEAVEFEVISGLRAENSLSISWSGSPGLSPTDSTLEFVEPSASQPPQLETYTGQRTVKLTLKDFCLRPMPLPAGQLLTFAADAPLAVSPPQQDPASTHVWTASVRLSACPADRSQPFAIWPIVNGEPWKSTSTARRVEPKCIAPLELKLLSLAESLSVEPGAMAEFELEVSNTVDTPITQGVLMASVEGLTVIGATLDGKPLTARKAGFELPELRKDAPLKVKLQVQATTQPDQVMQARLRCEDSAGTWISQETPVRLNAEKLGVDVGCGCHTATPAGQLLPWVLLLLAGSRRWVRLRRLRRGERTEH